ncbi:MAG: FtsX-like permease family protein [Jiangellaceae bacterium]
MRSGLSDAGLFRRQVLADRGAGLTVVAVVFAVAALLAAWPRSIESMFTAELRESIGQQSPLNRDLVGVLSQAPPLALVDESPTVEEVWAPLDEILDEIRAGFSPMVHEVTAPAEYTVRSSDGLLSTDRGPPDVRFLELSAIADPRYSDRIRIVDGELPAGAEIELAEEEQEDPRNVNATLQEPVRIVFDIALSTHTAERMSWDLGEVRRLTEVARVRLTGTFEPVDAAAEYWSHTPGVLEPVEVDDLNQGITVTGTGFAEPATFAEIAHYLYPPAFQGSTATTRVWFPVDGSTLRAGDGPVLLDGLNAQAARNTPMGEEGPFGQPPLSLSLSTGSADTLSRVLAGQASSASVVAMVAAGPLGVVLAVLALGGKLVVDRRQRAMNLLAARGGSGVQLRGLLAAEGLMLGLPAALLATTVVDRFVPGEGGRTGIVLPVLIGLAPAFLLPLVAGRAGTRTERRDLGTVARGWRRWVLDIATVGLAVGAVVLLNRRGLAAGSPDAGVDPLLAATPLLLATAASVVILRLYPLPVAALSRTLKTRRGLVGFLGTVRAVRDPVAGAAPVLALVVGLSVAVFSTVLWTTTQAGGVATGWQDVGADLAAEGPAFTPDQVEAVRDVRGVVAVAAVAEVRQVRAIEFGDETMSARLFTTDLAALSDVQERVPGGLSRPSTEVDDGTAAVVLSDQIGSAGLEGAIDITFPFVAVGSASTVPGIRAGGSEWMLVHRESLPDRTVQQTLPRQLLIRTDGAAVDEDALRAVLGSTVRLTTPAEVTAELRAGAASRGMIRSFVVAVAVAGLLSALAVVLTMVVNAPTRGRLLSQLRTLGLSGRQARGLVSWETAPVALVALGCGLALGAAVPWLVLSAVDLRPITGGDDAPPLTVDGNLVAVAGGAFVVVVLVAVVIAVASSQRLRLGTVLRVGEER